MHPPSTLWKWVLLICQNYRIGIFSDQLAFPNGIVLRWFPKRFQDLYRVGKLLNKFKVMSVRNYVQSIPCKVLHIVEMMKCKPSVQILHRVNKFFVLMAFLTVKFHQILIFPTTQTTFFFFSPL